MLREDDADIDALMGSVVGGNGKPAEFPAPQARPANVIPIGGRRVKAERPKDDFEALFGVQERVNLTVPSASLAVASGALAAELAANEAVRKVVDPRTVPVRFSNLRAMAASALHYWQAVQDDKADTIAMRFGRGVHALCLGTPVIRWTGKTRQGKAWEAFKAQHADKEILSTKEWDRAHGIYEALRRHPIASEWLFSEGTIREELIEWEFNGRKCTSRPDARRGTDRLIDLKTTRCAEPRKFSRDAQSRAYHAQFSFYGRAIAETFGSFPKESLVLAVEPVKPFAITPLELPQSALDEGEKAWRLWFEQLLVCEASNSWPAYTQTIEKFSVDADGDFSLVIDGEEHTFDD